jgi:hypothetical protein
MKRVSCLFSTKERLREVGLTLDKVRLAYRFKMGTVKWSINQSSMF